MTSERRRPHQSLVSKNLFEKCNMFFTVFSWGETRVPSQTLVSLLKEAEYSVEKHVVFSLLCGI